MSESRTWSASHLSSLRCLVQELDVHRRRRTLEFLARVSVYALHSDFADAELHASKFE